MPDFDQYLILRGRRSIPAVVRAIMAWQRIQDRATVITVYRNGAAQTAQSVRIEYSSVANDRRAAGEASVRESVIFGVMDHPNVAVPDTNLLKGDRFTVGSEQYEIKDVIVLPGEVQARAERIS
jgi:hypothetical protein